MRKETVDIDVLDLVMSRNGEIKIMQSNRIMNRPPQE